jgi:hypothetical protein
MTRIMLEHTTILCYLLTRRGLMLDLEPIRSAGSNPAGNTAANSAATLCSGTPFGARRRRGDHRRARRLIQRWNSARDLSRATRLAGLPLYFCLLPELGGGSDRRENVNPFTSPQQLRPVEYPEAYRGSRCSGTSAPSRAIDVFWLERMVKGTGT